MSEDLKLNALQRIAAALEKLAAHFSSDTADLRPGPVIYTPPVAATGTEQPNPAAALENDLAPVYSEPEREPATREDAIKSLNACGRKHGLEVAKRVLSTFGASLAAVPDDKLAELIATLEAL